MVNRAKQINIQIINRLMGGADLKSEVTREFERRRSYGIQTGMSTCTPQYMTSVVRNLSSVDFGSQRPGGRQARRGSEKF